MSAAAAALAAALLLLSSAARAADPRLSAATDPEPGAFRALPLSPGPGRPVCGRATFSRAKAAAGGLVFVTDAGGAGDADAIRASAAVVLRRGGLASPAAVAARRWGVPAASLGRGVWVTKGPALELSEPVYGPEARDGTLRARAVAGSRAAVLAEGTVVCVDAAAGRVSLPASADAVLAAAEAARAYDGLRDAAALSRWLTDSPDPARAAALGAELAPRALDGEVPAADLVRLAAAARAAAGAKGRAALDAAEGRAWRRALRRERARLEACPEEAADAPSREVLDRLSADARETASRAAAAARILGLSASALRAPAAVCASAAARRRKSVPAATPSLAEAVRAAGAEVPDGRELPAEAWRLFVADNGLEESLTDTAGDASLGLRLKSERLRARVLSGRLTPESPAGRAVLAAAPSCPCEVMGADATETAADAGALLPAVLRAWAAAWGPGPLGARLRAGAPVLDIGGVRVGRAAKAGVSGLVFSRDPGSGRRGRVLVEAAPGPLADLLSGTARSDRYALDPRTGRALVSSPGEPDGRLLLSAKRLARVARLARALDAWRGTGVEAAFSFDGERLLVAHARALLPPAPLTPRTDPLGPRPEPAQALDVRPVR